MQLPQKSVPQHPLELSDLQTLPTAVSELPACIPGPSYAGVLKAAHTCTFMLDPHFLENPVFIYGVRFTSELRTSRT